MIGRYIWGSRVGKRRGGENEREGESEREIYGGISEERKRGGRLGPRQDR